MAQAANTSPILLDAYRSYRAGRFADAMVLLDNLVTPGSRDPLPILLLCLANLQLNRYGRADELLKKIVSVNPHYHPYHELRAYLYMKGAPDFESALSYYVEVLGKYPADRALAKAMRRLRRAGNFERFQKEAKLDDFVRVPRPPGGLFDFSRPRPAGRPAPFPVREGGSGRRTRRRFIILAAAGVVVLAVAGLYFAREGLLRAFQGRPPAPGGLDAIEQVTLDGSGFDLIEKISRARRPEFYYSGTALRDDFFNSKQLIKNGRYNDALLVINKILNSNANMSVKERAAFLKSFIINIEDREWGDIPYREILNRPHLYGGVSVRWRGRVANLARRQTAQVFHLLVDYRSEDVFAGIADVFLETADGKLKNGDMVTVKAVYMDRISGGNPYLSAKELERAGE
jgi:tetratricopeptide (TPR) repeat protein